MIWNRNEMLDGRTRTSRVHNVSKNAWRLFCSHGTVLFYIARHPDCTISDIAGALALTPRTVWGLIGDLKRAGLVHSRREGRRHYYTINPSGRFPDPILSHLTLNDALRAIAQESDELVPAGRAGAGETRNESRKSARGFLRDVTAVTDA